jgi:hypothetical protein
MLDCEGYVAVGNFVFGSATGCGECAVNVMGYELRPVAA